MSDPGAGVGPGRYSAPVRFRVLGPVEIDSEGAAPAQLRRRERALLAILLLERERLVPADRLCDLLWDGDPPDGARRMLHSHVARIRARPAADRGAVPGRYTCHDLLRAYAAALSR